MTNRNWTRALAALLAVALAVALGACGSSSSGGGSSSSSGGSSGAQPGKGKPAFTLGDKNFPEEYILGQLYKQALEARGYTINLKENIGSSEIIDKSLTSGQIDGYPEYTGVIATELAHASDQPKTAQATYQRAKRFEARRGFAVTQPTPFFDADGLAVLPKYAKQHGLSTIGDLRKVPSFTYGAPPENATRFQGVVGMKKVYGLTNLKFKPIVAPLQYTALDKGDIDVAAIFTTDGQLLGGKYKVLPDTKGIFGFQNVVLVLDRRKLARMGPEFVRIINAVSAKLTNKAMQQMNAAVVLNKQKPDAVARQFLQANGLL